MIDHDGAPGEDGGIEAWLRLGQAVGLDPDQLRSQELVLPGVRFAVDAYVNFARRAASLSTCLPPSGNLNRAGIRAESSARR